MRQRLDIRVSEKKYITSPGEGGAKARIKSSKYMDKGLHWILFEPKERICNKGNWK